MKNKFQKPHTARKPHVSVITPTNNHSKSPPQLLDNFLK
jgi:hypothetical protein